MNTMCAEIETWLRQAHGASGVSLPPDELVAHISACPHCRGQLLALLAKLMGPQALSDMACAAVEQELAAFVDYERSKGLAVAARTFPAIWWHTLVCPSCDALYRNLQQLAELPIERWVASTPQRQTLWPISIQLDIGMIRQMRGFAQKLGRAWGPQQADMVIAEQQNTLGEIQIFLRRTPNEGFALIIQTRPPIEGTVVIALDDTSFCAPIDAQGAAVFDNLTDELFNADAASKLTLFIEPSIEGE